MTARKQIEVVAPALPADEAFGNVITARRDTAVVDMQALQSHLAARNGQYERDLARLEAEWKKDADSLAEQIRQQGSIINAADAALDRLTAALAPSNVVPLTSAAQ